MIPSAFLFKTVVGAAGLDPRTPAFIASALSLRTGVFANKSFFLQVHIVP